jgi:hypothetical protein
MPKRYTPNLPPADAAQVTHDRQSNAELVGWLLGEGWATHVAVDQAEGTILVKWAGGGRATRVKAGSWVVIAEGEAPQVMSDEEFTASYTPDEITGGGDPAGPDPTTPAGAQALAEEGFNNP